jgi:hypothetical protein
MMSSSRADYQAVFSLKAFSASWSFFRKPSTAATSDSTFSRAFSLCSSLQARSSAHLFASVRDSSKTKGDGSYSKIGEENLLDEMQQARNTFQLIGKVTIPNKLGTKTNKLFHQRLENNRDEKDNIGKKIDRKKKKLSRTLTSSI